MHAYMHTHTNTHTRARTHTHTPVFAPVSASAHIMVNTKAGQVLSIPKLEVKLEVQQVEVSLSKLQVSTAAHSPATPTNCHTVMGSQTWCLKAVIVAPNVCGTWRAQTNGQLSRLVSVVMYHLVVSTVHCAVC